MNGLVKAVRHIQIKKIAFTPQLYTAIITYEAHPTQYDESDDIEYQKKYMIKRKRNLYGKNMILLLQLGKIQKL